MSTLVVVEGHLPVALKGMQVALAAQSAFAMADVVIVDGVSYNLSSDAETKSAFVISSQGEPYSGDIVIAEEVSYDGDTYTVVGISDRAFYETAITSVVIPNTVSSIEYRAFSECSQLTEVVLPGSVNLIRELAFYSSGLQRLTLEYGERELYIGEDAFQYSQLSEVYIDRERFRNGGSAWSGLFHANVATFGSHVTTIPEAVLQNCELDKLTFLGDVTFIGGSAFRGTRLPADFTLPAHLQGIGVRAFERCTMPESLVLPITLNEIGGFAFNASTLTNVYVPWLTPLPLDDE